MTIVHNSPPPPPLVRLFGDNPYVNSPRQTQHEISPLQLTADYVVHLKKSVNSTLGVYSIPYTSCWLPIWLIVLKPLSIESWCTSENTVNYVMSFNKVLIMHLNNHRLYIKFQQSPVTQVNSTISIITQKKSSGGPSIKDLLWKNWKVKTFVFLMLFFGINP